VDLKPDGPRAFAGEFKPLGTPKRGRQSASTAQMAAVADKVTFVRSLVSHISVARPGRMLVMTHGHKPTGPHYPSLGSLAAK